MPKITRDDIELEYEVFGDLTNEVLIGVQGFAEGWRFWPKSFIDAVVNAGYCFVAFDNRDIGGSSFMSDFGFADIPGAFDQLAQGIQPQAAYTVDVLGDDIIRVMDGLNIQKAHLIGYSMGGIAIQWAAINHPERVISLLPLMTTTSHPDLPPARQSALDMAFAIISPIENEQVSRERIATMFKVTTGFGFPGTEQEEKEFVDLLLEQGYQPAAMSRQLLSIYAAEPHFEKIQGINCPTTVIHGTDDCFFTIEHGQDVANRIPNAKLTTVEGLGHNLAESFMPTLSQITLNHLSAITSKKSSLTA